MFDDNNLFKALMENSGAALIIQKVQSKLEEEKKKRQEFYETITEDDKAEFINGEIVYHSPVVKEHNDATKLLLRLIDVFVDIYEAGYVGVEKILTTFTRNDYEPDICFFGKEKAKDIKKGQMLFPVPDLAVEVLSKSPKSLKRDKKTKFDDYELHGVREYWMIDAQEETVEQYRLEEGKYKLVLKSSEGHITSEVVEGFTIPIRAIFDKKENLKTLWGFRK